MPSSESAPPLPVAVVRPAAYGNPLDLRELWEYRDVVEALVRRDIALRYKQTIAGVLWVVGQPVLITLILSLLMGRLVSQPASGQPYPLFVYAALVPWAYLSHALTKSSTCFTEPPGLVTRVYLPRLLLPLAVALAALADYGVTLVFLFALMFFFGVAPSLTILALPLILLLTVLTAFGLGVWLSTFNAEYRDIAFALPFLLQLGLFVTPIFYSSALVPMPWRLLYALNPIVGVVEGMRWVFLSAGDASLGSILLMSSFGALLVLAGGLYVFQRRDPELADVI